jgi:hypothetical protein
MKLTCKIREGIMNTMNKENKTYTHLNATQISVKHSKTNKIKMKIPHINRIN